jgi:hypothetical protein
VGVKPVIIRPPPTVKLTIVAVIVTPTVAVALMERGSRVISRNRCPALLTTA